MTKYPPQLSLSERLRGIATSMGIAGNYSDAQTVQDGADEIERLRKIERAAEEAQRWIHSEAPGWVEEDLRLALNPEESKQ